jgi:hypothetical protein
LADTFPVISDYIAAKGGTERIPTIDTETNNSGSKRTYTLNDRDGYVGARVIRYDEDQGGAMQFLSGAPLWKMVFRNPHQTEPGADDINNVYANCTKHHYMRALDGDGLMTYPTDPDSNTGNVAEGFIFDLPMPGAPPAPLTACAENALKLLQRGIVSETCAKYGTYSAMKPGYPEHPYIGREHHYDVKFAPCK